MKRKPNRYRSDSQRLRRTLLWCCKNIVLVLVGLSSIVVLSAALAYSYHGFVEASWLRVKEIQITGLQHLSRNEVLNAMGVPRGANILSLKTGQIAAHLGSLPWVRSALVRLDPPGKVVVEVAERQPLAIIHADHYYLSDTEGKLFTRLDEESKPADMLVVGFPGASLKEGDYLPSEPLHELKQFLVALDKSKNWLPQNKVFECRWDTDHGFVFQTMENLIVVKLGSEDLTGRLDRLQRILKVLEQNQLTGLTTHVDLDFSNLAYVEGNFPVSKARDAKGKEGGKLISGDARPKLRNRT